MPVNRQLHSATNLVHSLGRRRQRLRLNNYLPRIRVLRLQMRHNRNIRRHPRSICLVSRYMLTSRRILQRLPQTLKITNIVMKVRNLLIQRHNLMKRRHLMKQQSNDLGLIRRALITHHFNPHRHILMRSTITNRLTRRLTNPSRNPMRVEPLLRNRRTRHHPP